MLPWQRVRHKEEARRTARCDNPQRSTNQDLVPEPEDEEEEGAKADYRVQLRPITYEFEWQAATTASTVHVRKPNGQA